MRLRSLEVFICLINCPATNSETTSSSFSRIRPARSIIVVLTPYAEKKMRKLHAGGAAADNCQMNCQMTPEHLYQTITKNKSDYTAGFCGITVFFGLNEVSGQCYRHDRRWKCGSSLNLLFLRPKRPTHNSPGQRRVRRRPGLRDKNIQPPCKGKTLWHSGL